MLSTSLCCCTGARGLLAEEEERLFKLRQEIEGEARQELDRARMELEEKGRTTQSGKLCATPFGVDIVGITELIALTGALVGGVLRAMLRLANVPACASTWRIVMWHPFHELAQLAVMQVSHSWKSCSCCYDNRLSSPC